jgi:iron complex transport system permease protein
VTVGAPQKASTRGGGVAAAPDGPDRPTFPGGGRVGGTGEEAASSARIRRRPSRTGVLTALGGLVALSALLSLTLGAVSIPPGETLRILLTALGVTPGTVDPLHETVILSIRAPRVLLGAVVGGGLAVSGAALQGLFRNPLADPGLIGVSAGSALAAVVVTVLGGTLLAGVGIGTPVLLSVGAFIGGVGAVALVYRVATHEGRTSVATMLLAGIAVNALAGAATGVFIFASDEQQLRDFTFWTMGSLAGRQGVGLWVALLVLLPGILVMPFLGGPLNALLLGEREARHLGVDVDRVRRLVFAGSALTVGGAVAVAGIIGFVGLITPHLVRLAFGPDHRLVLPGSALLGAALLILADLGARTLVAPAELPVGAVTALVGGPFFLWLIVRSRSRGELAA